MQLHYVQAEYCPDQDALKSRLHIDEDYEDEFDEILGLCLKRACPKGVFTMASATQNNGVTVVGGHAFKSRVLAVNFRDQAFVYPYVITCGRELYDFARETDDPLYRFWIDGISEDALRCVGMKLRRAVQETFGLDQVGSVNPGSLQDFPLACQRPLFDMLGEGPDTIGLELTDSFLMLPYKSGSGIYFKTDRHYENCALCPRLTCPNRRMPYSEEMLSAYGLEPQKEADTCRET